MCGINGFVNLTKDVSNMKNTIYSMNNALKKKCDNEDRILL